MVKIELTAQEFEYLVRLSHHVTGEGFDRLYRRLHELRPWEAIKAENMGPLPDARSEHYGDRPMVQLGEDNGVGYLGR